MYVLVFFTSYNVNSGVLMMTISVSTEVQAIERNYLAVHLSLAQCTPPSCSSAVCLIITPRHFGTQLHSSHPAPYGHHIFKHSFYVTDKPIILWGVSYRMSGIAQIKSKSDTLYACDASLWTFRRTEIIMKLCSTLKMVI